jgi:hypothetical protein
MHIALSARAVGRTLGAVIALLVVASGAGQTMKYVFGHGHLHGLVPLFNLDGEQNVPTWYQAVALLACAVLLGLIGAAQRRTGRARHWWALAAVFVFMSVDEVATMHERLQGVLHGRVPVGGYLHYVWIVPYGLGAVLLAVLSIRFLRGLPRATRRGFLASGGLFVGGAVVMEMLSGKYASARGEQNGTFILMTHIEETIEMAAIALLLVTLLRHMRDHVGQVRFEVASARQNESSAATFPVPSGTA